MNISWRNEVFMHLLHFHIKMLTSHSFSLLAIYRDEIIPSLYKDLIPLLQTHVHMWNAYVKIFQQKYNQQIVNAYFIIYRIGSKWKIKCSFILSAQYVSCI
jgi:hypothetical protein